MSKSAAVQAWEEVACRETRHRVSWLGSKRTVMAPPYIDYDSSCIRSRAL
jgi:hypothetical protein